MSGCARASETLLRPLRRLGAALGLALGAAFAVSGAVRAEAPARVVSINVCTDQLAMMLAAPGQLISVSWLGADPRSSAMAAQARHYRLNHAQAEEVFLMHPDLVLAGRYSSAATVGLLRRLGVKVVQLPITHSLDGVTAALLTVGRALGREARAQALAARFRADLAALRVHTADPIRAALYYPNGYTPGAGTLANDILQAAGFRNIAAEDGLSGGGVLPLERLVMAQPRLIVTAKRYPGASEAESILSHPALKALEATAGKAVVSDADWVCGTPKVLGALRTLVKAHATLEAGK